MFANHPSRRSTILLTISWLLTISLAVTVALQIDLASAHAENDERTHDRTQQRFSRLVSHCRRVKDMVEGDVEVLSAETHDREHAYDQAFGSGNPYTLSYNDLWPCIDPASPDRQDEIKACAAKSDYKCLAGLAQAIADSMITTY